MLLTSIKCSNCGAYHDATLGECPECHKNNELRALKDFPKNVLFLHPIAQIALFIIGFAYCGMFIVGVIFASFIDNSLVVESLIYGVTLIGILSIILITRRKMFFDSFKGIYKYGIGAIVGLVAAGLGFGLVNLIGLWYHGDPNNNQETIESYVVIYPIISFFLFCIVGPFCEELTYRVGLYSFLRRFNKVAAYVVAIIAFTFIHIRFNNPDLISELWAIPSYVLAAFFLTLAYEKGGLPASLSAHIVYNIVSFIMTLVQYGQQS